MEQMQAKSPAAACLPEGADFCQIITRKALPGITADIRRYGWSRSYDGRFQPDLCYLDFALACRSDRSVMIDDRRFVQPGTLVFIPPGMRYSTHCESSEHLSLCLSYDPRRVLRLSGGDDDILAQLEPCLDVRDTRIERYVHDLAEEIQDPGFAADVTIELLCDAIIVGLARHFARRRAGAEPARSMMAPWRMRKLKERIHDALDQPLSVTALAADCGISTRHLVRTFKNSEGVTLSGFIAGERVKRAKSLLSGSGDPIKLIAARCGFGSASSFSVAFLSAVGTTPRQYRQSYRALSVGRAG